MLSSNQHVVAPAVNIKVREIVLVATVVIPAGLNNHPRRVKDPLWVRVPLSTTGVRQTAA